MPHSDVVPSQADRRSSSAAPLIVLEPLRRFLEELGIACSELSIAPIGEGHSNITYKLIAGDVRLVLRRPPRPPYPPSAHNVVREARLLQKLEGAGVRAPHVIAICESTDVIGAPFYVMEFLDGVVMSDAMPPRLDTSEARRAIGDRLVEALAELHAADVDAAGLGDLRRPGYLARQLRTFGGIWQAQRTRDLPEMDAVERWLAAHVPAGEEATVVHGDFRLGNVMFASEPPPRVLAILDWEMATVGDPLADLGYLCASWGEPGAEENPIRALSVVTRLPTFPSVEELPERYARRTGRDVSRLRWYEVLALWKSAVFLESSYRRFIEGTTADPYFEQLGAGVPTLAREAVARTTGGEPWN